MITVAFDWAAGEVAPSVKRFPTRVAVEQCETENRHWVRLLVIDNTGIRVTPQGVRMTPQEALDLGEVLQRVAMSAFRAEEQVSEQKGTEGE